MLHDREDGRWPGLVLLPRGPQRARLAEVARLEGCLALGGTTYLSNACCILRPPLFNALFIVSGQGSP